MHPSARFYYTKSAQAKYITTPLALLRHKFFSFEEDPMVILGFTTQINFTTGDGVLKGVACIILSNV